MNIELELAIILLKLSKNGPFRQDLLNKNARIPLQTVQQLLLKMQNTGLVKLDEAIVDVGASQRLRLAVHAISLGADPERALSFLQWHEFEAVAAFALEQNGYSIVRNLRFKQCGRKWEMDIIGCKKPLVVCMDCKHWHRRMQPSALKKIVEEQAERTKALVRSFPNPTIKIECATWNMAKFVPVVLSLVEGKFRFYDSVPIVPVHKLQDFSNQLSAHIDLLKHYRMQPDSQLGNKSPF